jgi:hypothetical protein
VKNLSMPEKFIFFFISIKKYKNQGDFVRNLCVANLGENAIALNY